MNARELRKVVICASLMIAAIANSDDQEINGVFGLEPVPAPTSIAVWVPLEDGQAVTGVRWFNNDELAVFPTVRAMAGLVDRPETLSGAVIVGENVAGSSSAWSTISFPQPLASDSEGIYLVFELPTGGELVAEGEGGGHGLGYQLGDGRIRCWVSTESGAWDALSPQFQLAVAPVVTSDKTGDVLVLRLEHEVARSTIDATVHPPRPRSTKMVVAPNPFNPATEIRYSLSKAGLVTLEIHDVRGRMIRTLVDGHQPVGEYTATWDGRDGMGRTQASGTYLARLKIGSVQLVERMTLLK